MPAFRRAVARFVDFAPTGAAAVALFLFDALPVPGSGRRSLADRMAGTSVTGLGLSRPAAMRPVRTS